MTNDLHVLITGTAGLLGGLLRYRWSDLLKLSEVDRNAASISHRRTGSMNTFQLDITDEEAVRTLIHTLRPDVVVNCAAMTAVDGCEENPLEASRINADAVGFLARACEEANSRLVQISTDAVFDGALDRPYTENDEPNPINVYGKTKLAGEREALAYNRNLVIRTNIFGWNLVRDKGSFGEWLYDAILNSRPATVFADVLFSPIYVGLFESYLLRAIKAELCGVYHLAGGDIITKEGFAREMARALTRDHTHLRTGSLHDVHLKAPRAHNMSLSSKAFEDRFKVALPSADGSIAAFLKDRTTLPLVKEGNNA